MSRKPSAAAHAFTAVQRKDNLISTVQRASTKYTLPVAKQHDLTGARERTLAGARTWQICMAHLDAFDQDSKARIRESHGTTRLVRNGDSTLR